MVPALYSALTVNSLAHSYVRRAPCLEPKNSVLLELQDGDPSQSGPKNDSRRWATPTVCTANQDNARRSSRGKVKGVIMKALLEMPKLTKKRWNVKAGVIWFAAVNRQLIILPLTAWGRWYDILMKIFHKWIPYVSLLTKLSIKCW